MASTPPETCREGAALLCNGSLYVTLTANYVCFLLSLSPKNSCQGWNVCEVISNGKLSCFFPHLALCRKEGKAGDVDFELVLSLV